MPSVDFRLLFVGILSEGYIEIMENLQDDLSILIPDGQSRFALLVVRCLSHVNGVKVHVLSSDPWARVRFSRYCSSFTYHDGTHDDETVLREIIRTAQREKASILLPVSESGIRFVAARLIELNTMFIAPIPQLDKFDIAVNKWKFADFMQTHSIPTPRTILFRKNVSFNEQMEGLKFPVLLKPTRSTNGSGIIQFDDIASLERFFEARINDASEYIIQDYVNGYDIDCSVLCRDGEIVAHTIQKGIISNPQRFHPPSAIEFMGHEEVLEVASKLVCDLCWNGVAHIDMMVDAENDRVVVIELNARYWGSLMGSLKAGVNFPFLAAIAGLGQPTPNVSFRNIRYIEPFVALKLLTRRPFLHCAGGLPLSESGWCYFLADPLATIAGKIIPMLRNMKLTNSD